jgi:hypothetical protein
VDFKEHIHLGKQHAENETIDCIFTKINQPLCIHYRQFDHLALAWVMS